MRIEILIKKNTPPKNWIILVKIRQRLHPYLHNKVNVPLPGIIQFIKILKKDAHPNVEIRWEKFSPYPIIISRGFILIFMASVIVFLFIADNTKEINVPIAPIKIKVILIGNIVIILSVSFIR